MSVTIWFTQVTPEQLATARDDPEWAWDQDWDGDVPGADLDSSWPGLEHLFGRAGVGIDILGAGGEPVDDDGTLFAWAPDEVEHVATVLRDTSWEQLAAHYDPAELSRLEVYPGRHLWAADDLEPLRWGYQALTAFFATVSAARAPALMFFSF
ncbi:DUF1877 family protein [Actinocatenispora comari]|jgi:hypothetical protein|uniref:DUF1877 family protein n=1 Tax=Actinocatenispora comari TaxID=2807577 RepID=A0A8J4A6D4_9ACTN|nr:DUF1877 family protein [Actinocatenispora comari]GIL24945.1 hypothetical protein NUM_02000 [Actinocatenispora comari]